jgi:hypothetical protein
MKKMRTRRKTRRSLMRKRSRRRVNLLSRRSPLKPLQTGA